MSAGGTPGTGLAGLRRLATPRAPRAPEPPPEERCEMCGVAVAEEHGHVADTQDHRLLCVCRPCYLLFSADGAGGARFRGVGTTVHRVDDLTLDEVTWSALEIPVELAFFLGQGDPPSYAAFYPGPSGATESTLDLASWLDILAANPALARVQPDVEAILLRHHDPGFSCYVTPVDVCYELVGIVRTHWVGLAGGAEVWERIDAFFDNLARRSTPTSRAG
ncbi:MAG: DUF5947 family protein [Nocardioides sp.]